MYLSFSASACYIKWSVNYTLTPQNFEETDNNGQKYLKMNIFLIWAFLPVDRDHIWKKQFSKQINEIL